LKIKKAAKKKTKKVRSNDAVTSAWTNTTTMIATSADIEHA